MCVVCDNIDKYNEEYPLGLMFDTELQDPLDCILVYFHMVEQIQTLCIEQIKKKAYKHYVRCGGGLTRFKDIPAPEEPWFRSQCFYSHWIQFKDHVTNEKKKINEEIKYLF